MHWVETGKGASSTGKMCKGCIMHSGFGDCPRSIKKTRILLYGQLCTWGTGSEIFNQVFTCFPFAFFDVFENKKKCTICVFLPFFAISIQIMGLLIQCNLYLEKVFFDRVCVLGRVVGYD